jgi:UDP-N-acetylmuramoyl-tripeptide--D-alanyl-D-alanine ligase
MKKFASKPFLWYLRTAAKIQLSKSNNTVIGIGGSSGKTSLCRIVEEILKTKYKVKASRGLNSETGVALSILKLIPGGYTLFDWLRISFLIPIRLLTLREKYDFYVCEMAFDRPGVMKQLINTAHPKIATLTNISLEHSENFDKLVPKESKGKQNAVLEFIAKEESLLLKSTPADGIAILNIDDPEIEKLKNEIKAKPLTISAKYDNADFFAKDIAITLERLEMNIVYSGKVFHLKTKRALSYCYVYTILLAVAISVSAGLSIEKTIEAISQKLNLPNGRLSIFKGIKNTTLIDSSYNAQPIAMLDALDFLKTVSKERRRVAILGEMRELGEETKQEHEKIAKKIKESVDFAVLIGPSMKKYVSPILDEVGLNYKYFPNFTSSKEFVKNNIKGEDVILVKGSQNTLLLERAVEMLLADKNNVKKLTRPNKFWEKQRKLIP